MNVFIQDVVAEAIQKQSFFQKNANTIVAGIGALAAILAFVVTLPFELPEVVHASVPAVVSVLTAFAIKLTPNGVQPSMAPKLEATVAATRPALTGPGMSVIAAEIERVRGYVGQHRLGG